MEKIFTLQCARCGKIFPPETSYFSCPICDKDGIHNILEVVFDIEILKKNIAKQDFSFNTNYSLWRFLPFLPVGDIRTIQPLKTGCTPLYNSLKLASRINVQNIYIKDEGRNPTGSFKDRVSAVGVSLAMEKGFKKITCASTGNMASSVACFAASAGLKTTVLVPETIPEPQISQILIYGAKVIKLRGTYQDAQHICGEMSEKYQWYNLSCINPFLVEGQKTIAYEICEQLGFETPDRIFLSVGDGQTIYGIYKGYKEFLEMGFIHRMPQLIGVQAQNASPIVDLFETGTLGAPHSGHTIADSINISSPLHARHAVQVVKDSGGCMTRVTDEEILEAMKAMASDAGVFGEPAAAAALAGAIKLRREGLMGPHEQIVVISSGVGLKDIQSAMKASGSPVTCGLKDSAIDDIFNFGTIKSLMKKERQK